MQASERVRSVARATVFKAMGHPTRVFILEKLQDGPHCVCELTELVGADMSTVSKHLAILKNAGIVQDRKEGTTVYYSLACSCLADMLRAAENVIRGSVERQNASLASLKK